MSTTAARLFMVNLTDFFFLRVGLYHRQIERKNIIHVVLNLFGSWMHLHECNYISAISAQFCGKKLHCLLPIVWQCMKLCSLKLSTDDQFEPDLHSQSCGFLLKWLDFTCKHVQNNGKCDRTFSMFSSSKITKHLDLCTQRKSKNK